MAHTLQALIGEHAFLESRTKAWIGVSCVPLRYGLDMAPLLPKQIENLFGKPETDQTSNSFNHFHAGMRAPLEQLSIGGQLAYIETDYFGGVGGQGAVVFDNGRLVFGPDWSAIGPINAALNFLGVPESDHGYDAFDQLGLGRHRRTESWISQ